MYKKVIAKSLSPAKKIKKNLKPIFRAYYFNVPPVTRQILFSKKESDTLFILGSGSSVCNYTSQMWEKIKSNDSIGFNFWILHEFVPTFYVTEFYVNKGKNKNRVDTLFKNLLAVKEKYHSCLKMFKSPISDEQYKKLRKVGGYTAFSHWIKAKDSKHLLNEIPKLTTKKSFYPIFYHQTATLDWVIFFALVLGYKQIILCGVDLNSTEYFYEKEYEKIQSRGLIIPNNLHKQQHKTNDPKQNKGILISEVIKCYQNANLKNLPEIYIASEKSALYPQLPLYHWN